MKKRITDNTIISLKSKENLIRYMDMHGRRVTNNPNASILFACPFCNSGNHDHRNSDSGFSIYSNRNGYGMYHCFSCDRSGDIISLYAEQHKNDAKKDFTEICEELAKELYITLDYEDGSTFKPVSNNQKSTVKKSLGRVFNHVDFTPKNQDKELPESPRRERQHVYTNENGQPIAVKKMKIRKDGSKSFIWYLINSETGEIASKYGLNGLELPLYNICAVNQAKENGQIVFVVEGEKDVDTLQNLGYIATTKPNGAKNHWTSNFIEPLKKLNVIVLLDNDKAGADCGKMAITALLDVTASLKVIPSASLYPELPNKGDISDIVDMLGAEKTKEILDSAITDEKYLVTEDTFDTEQDDDANDEESSKKEKKQQFDCDCLDQFLQDNKITARYNEVTTDIDMEIHGDLFKNENQEFISEMLPSLLEVPLKIAYKGANINNITRYLDIVAKRHAYNPVLELIQSVKWDGHDYFNDFCDMLGIGEQIARKTDAETYAKYAFYRQGILKWLMQCICGLHNTKLNPFSLDIVLVLQGGQGISKTRLFENLALKPQFFGDGTSIDPRNKDTLLEALSKWICELGEIGSTFKKDIDLLKAFITHAVDEIRRPYARKASRIARHTSFCGSVNDDKYLIDETGNRRFFTIKLPESLVIDYETQIKTFNFLQLWAHINVVVENHVKNYGETYAGCFRLSDSEKRTLQIYNAEHEKPLKGEIEIRDTIYKLEGNPKVMHRYMTITEFLTENLALKNITAMQAGKVLNRLQYQPRRVYRNGNTSTVYNLPYISYP